MGMAARLERLRGREAFSAVFEKGCVGRSRLVVVRLLPRCAGAPPRAAAVAAKRLGSAVRRNRIRRRLRGALRGLAGRLPPADLVVLARHGCEKAAFAELQEAVRKAVERAWEARTS